MDAFLVVLAACLVGSFALCGVPFGLIIAQRMSGVDVREVGSGNIGMTNVARSAGGSAAALTFVCDVGKGTLSVAVSRLLMGLVLPEGMSFDVTAPGFAALTLVYACCVLGHVFSPYLGFHGGKGISVGFGAALALHWPMALVLLACFVVLALPTRYVSAGSLAAAILLPVQALFLWHFTPWAAAPICIASAVVVWAHRGNVVKLLHGEENRFSVKSGDGKGRRRRVAPTQRRDGE